MNLSYFKIIRKIELTKRCLWASMWGYYEIQTVGSLRFALALYPELLGSFRLDYEYEIEYEYDFQISNQWSFQSPNSSRWFWVERVAHPMSRVWDVLIWSRKTRIEKWFSSSISYSYANLKPPISKTHWHPSSLPGVYLLKRTNRSVESNKFFLSTIDFSVLFPVRIKRFTVFFGSGCFLNFL